MDSRSLDSGVPVCAYRQHLVGTSVSWHVEGREASMAEPNHGMDPGASIFLSYAGPVAVLLEADKCSSCSLVRTIGEKDFVSGQKMSLFGRVRVGHLLTSLAHRMMRQTRRSEAAQVP